METRMMRTDSEIKKLVSDELKWDTRVAHDEVNIAVDNGIVTLTGTVTSFGARQIAQRAAHRVAGVLDVVNDIYVKTSGSEGRSDTVLAKSVRHALEWDVFVPEQRIRTTVSAGWVTLEGEVEHWSEREAAEHAIHNLSGLAGVVNKIEVSPNAFAGDVRHAIESALDRHAVREARHLNVDVQHGLVTITGTVASYAEKKAVLGAVRSTKGVLRIEDHLQIV
jgi:osmotically-inducible protein OsmY